MAAKKTDSTDKITCVWLDASIHTTQQNLELQEKIRSITRAFKPFNDKVLCEDFIRSIPGHHDVILIASGGLSKELVPSIHQLSQLTLIYVYCMKKEFMEAWAKDYKKVREVVVKSDELIHAIQRDIRGLTSAQSSANDSDMFAVCENPQKTVGELNGDFIYSQLLIDVLRLLPDDPEDQKKLSNLLLTTLSPDDDRKLVTDFCCNKYSSQLAVYWYTTPTNIHKRLNSALSKQDIDELFLFRHFIRDLYSCMENYPYTFIKEVHRGQYTHLDEVLHLQKSKGKMVSVNSFFSTSKDLTEAKFFIQKSAPSASIKRVLFTVTCKPNIGKIKPAADVENISKFETEKEVLFVPGSIFRIENIEQDKDGIYRIEMEVCAENENPVHEIYQKMKRDLGTKMKDVDLVVYGDLLYQISKYKLAQKIFMDLSKKLSSTDPKLIRVNFFLGMLAYHEDDYKKSLSYYEKAIDAAEKTQNKSMVNILELYNCIGEAYRAQKDLDAALEWQNKILEVCERRPEQYQHLLAHSYNNIGLIYADQKAHGKSVKYHYKSLGINEKILEKDHPDLARNHHNIGIALDAMGQSTEAMEQYETCLGIQYRTLPSNHVSIGHSHQCIGCLHYGQKRWKEAKKSFTKAQEIYKHTYGDEHTKLVRVKEYIDCCDEKLKH